MTRATVFAACLVMAAVACRSNDDKRPRPEMSTPPPAAAKPDQPAAAQFAAWLAAFNTADRTQLVAYHDKLFPYAVASADIGDIERELALARGTGGFDLRKAEQSSATRYTALMQEKESDQFARATMDVDAAAPHRVTKFHIGPVPTPDEFRARRTSEAEALKALRAELDHVVARDRFSGAVLVAKNGKPIFAEAYGMADREHKVPNKLDTKFRIGSMNKMFTATATIQLVQAGKLAVADTLGKIVHDYPNTTLASKVTLHHMLTHTGGTGDIFGPEFDKHRLELRTLQDYVNLYGKRDLAYEPGSKWAYSNYGFVLLGVVIERATGKSYYDRVDEHVFKPAGMTATASLPEDQVVPDRSISYTRQDPTKPWAPNTDTLPYRGTSAGGGYSTVTDLLRFANALTKHELLDARHTELLTTSKTETPNGGKYGYGFGESTTDGVRCFGHGGGAPGMNGDLQICGSGYTIVVLANLDPPAASHLSGFVSSRLPARP